MKEETKKKLEWNSWNDTWKKHKKDEIGNVK